MVWRNLLFRRAINYIFIKRELNIEIIPSTASSDFHQPRSLLAPCVLNDLWYKAKLCSRCVIFYNNCMVQAFSHFLLRPFNICFIKMVFRFFSGPQMSKNIKWDTESHILLFFWVTYFIKQISLAFVCYKSPQTYRFPLMTEHSRVGVIFVWCFGVKILKTFIQQLHLLFSLLCSPS